MGLSQETKNDRLIEKMSDIQRVLKDHENRILALEKALSKYSVKEVISEVNGFEKFSIKLNLDLEKIRNIYEIDESSLVVLRSCGEDDRERIKNITLIALLGYKYIFGEEKVLSKEIRRNVMENRIPVNNFSTYINELIPSQIRRIGKVKSSTTRYKLTPLGEAEAKGIIQKLCN
jgi:hypothetical protein